MPDSLATATDSLQATAPALPATNPAAPPPANNSPATAPAGPPAMGPAVAGETAASTTSSDGSCWRLQVAAPVEKAEAESRRDAAQSLLVVPMAIEFEKSLYKVRTQGCLSRAAADAVRQRALDSGFTGAFVLNTRATVAPTTHKPKPATHATRSHKTPAKKKPTHK